jgi:hypothetical protein
MAKNDELFNKIKELNINTSSNLSSLKRQFETISDLLNYYLENNKLIIGEQAYEDNIILKNFFTQKPRSSLLSLVSLKTTYKHTRKDRKINDTYINISKIYILAKKYEEFINIVRTNSQQFDITLNNKFILLLIKSVIYYYQYYYYIQKINDNPHLSSYDAFIDNVISEYNEFILKIYNDARQPPIPEINRKMNPIELNKLLYKFTLRNFIKYNIKEAAHLDTYDIYTKSLTDELMYDIFTNFNIVSFTDNNNDIFSLIYLIKSLISNNVEKTDYVTIPQYEGICWFIAYLTCICYSDNSKKLLSSKLQNIEMKSIIERDYDMSYPNIQFIKFVNNILTNITSKFIKYENLDSISDDSNFKCNLYKTLQSEPFDLLQNMYYKYNNEITSLLEKIINTTLSNSLQIELEEMKIKVNTLTDKSSDEKEGIIESFKNDLLVYYRQQFIEKLSRKGTYEIEPYETIPNLTEIELEYSFLMNAYIQKLNNGNDLDTLTKLTKQDNIGISSEDEICYKLFYKYLNINCFYLIKHNNILYIPIDTTSSENPDVILISVFGITNKIYKNSYSIFENKSLLEHLGDEEITYNGHPYILDYLIISATDLNTGDGIDHIISCIRYNNEQYHYDSKHFITKLNCNGTSIRIPCPLVRKEWISDKEHKKYCSNKCHYALIEEKHKTTAINERCYSTKSNFIYGYVKKI